MSFCLYLSLLLFVVLHFKWYFVHFRQPQLVHLAHPQARESHMGYGHQNFYDRRDHNMSQRNFSQNNGGYNRWLFLQYFFFFLLVFGLTAHFKEKSNIYMVSRWVGKSKKKSNLKYYKRHSQGDCQSLKTKNTIATISVSQCVLSSCLLHEVHCAYEVSYEFFSIATDFQSILIWSLLQSYELCSFALELPWTREIFYKGLKRQFLTVNLVFEALKLKGWIDGFCFLMTYWSHILGINFETR